MSKPIYKFWTVRYKEAWYKLSEEERKKELAKGLEALEKVGAKTLIEGTALWSSEQWMECGVEEFPDIEAVQKHAKILFDLGHYRYREVVSVLATKEPLF